MLKTYEAILNNGQLTWLDTPPTASHAKVFVTVMADDKPLQKEQKERKLGFMRGEIHVPDDINQYDDEVAKLFGVDTQ